MLDVKAHSEAANLPYPCLTNKEIKGLLVLLGVSDMAAARQKLMLAYNQIDAQNAKC